MKTAYLPLIASQWQLKDCNSVSIPIHLPRLIHYYRPSSFAATVISQNTSSQPPPPSPDEKLPKIASLSTKKCKLVPCYY